jgi:hypothetical protein
MPKIAIHQEAPGSWHIALPAKPPHIDELTEEDLERVAGGTTPVEATITIFTASTVSSAVLASAVVSVDRGW